MKKILLTLCTLLFVFAAPLSAFEWGGLVTNDTGIQTPDFSTINFSQSNGVSIWFKTPFDAEGNFGLSGEVLYKYVLKTPGNTFTNIFDVTLLKVYGEVESDAGIFTLNAGRFSYVDSTGAVVAHTVDGISADFAMPVVKLGAFAGYTGLLNSLNGSIVSAGNASEFYDMSYAYVPAGISIEFPYLPANQSLGIQAYAIIDCGNNPVKSNLCYADLILSGPITNSIYYNISTVFGFVDFKDIMNYSACSLMIFPTEEISISAGADFGTATDGTFVAYRSPLSATAAEVSSNIIPRVSFTYGTQNMCFDLGGKYKLGYDYADKKYAGLGAEVSTGFVYNIFSDLQVGVNATAFFDATPAKNNSYTANLNIALAF